MTLSTEMAEVDCWKPDTSVLKFKLWQQTKQFSTAILMEQLKCPHNICNVRTITLSYSIHPESWNGPWLIGMPYVHWLNRFALLNSLGRLSHPISLTFWGQQLGRWGIHEGCKDSLLWDLKVDIMSTQRSSNTGKTLSEEKQLCWVMAREMIQVGKCLPPGWWHEFDPQSHGRGKEQNTLLCVSPHICVCTHTQNKYTSSKMYSNYCCLLPTP